MASALTVQTILQTGLTEALVAADATGNFFTDQGDQRTFLLVRNNSGAAITVTVARQGSANQRVRGYGELAVPNKPNAASIAAGDRVFFGPFPQAYIATDSTVNVTYSAVTSVTVAALRLALSDQ